MVRPFLVALATCLFALTASATEVSIETDAALEIAELEKQNAALYETPADSPICSMDEDALLDLGLSEEAAADAVAGDCACPLDPATQVVVTDICRLCGNAIDCARQRCSVRPIGGGPVTQLSCEMKGGGCSATGDQSSLVALFFGLGFALVRRRSAARST